MIKLYVILINPTEAFPDEIKKNRLCGRKNFTKNKKPFLRMRKGWMKKFSVPFTLIVQGLALPQV